MGSKWLFWILAILVFGTLSSIGIYFYTENPTVFWIIEGISIIAILLFFFLYYRMLKPYRILLDGMDLLKAQDFSSRLRPVKNQEANRLIEVFNRMITQLKNERLSVRETNRFLDLLIEASPQGVIVMDFDGYITRANTAALDLLQVEKNPFPEGRKMEEIPGELARRIAGMHNGEEAVIRTAEQRVFRCTSSSFIDSGFSRPFVLIEELTEELAWIEKASYERIIRMMSHEVNNSIGAIGSTLNVISEVLHGESTENRDDIHPALDASIDRCGKLARFVGDLADVVRIPEPVLAEVSLNELVRSVEALTRIECDRRNIRLELSLTPHEPRVLVDGIQFEQVLVNIVKNAYEAIGRNGEIRITTTSDPVSVSVEDSGPGIPEEVKAKLFTPFFTTKPTGQGIGLMFIREVLNNHRLRFSLTSQEKTIFRIGW